MTKRKSIKRTAVAALPVRRPTLLLADVRELIVQARASVAQTVNSGLTLLYWQIGERMRREVLRELAFMPHPDNGDLLRDRLVTDEHPDVRCSAVQELVRLFKSHADTLPLIMARATSDEHANVRKGAVQELADVFKDDPGTLPIMMDRARFDESPEVRAAAVERLKRRWRDDSRVTAWLSGLEVDSTPD